MRRIIYLALVMGLITGCSATRKIHDPNSNITVIDYSAERRGAYLIKSADNKTIIVSEPSPDTTKDITASLGLSAETIGELASPELKAEYAGKVVDLANRSQTLQVLREALYRLAEMGANTNLTEAQRVALYNKVLDTVVLIAATEFANSDAPEEVKKKQLGRILSDVQKGTIATPGD